MRCPMTFGDPCSDRDEGCREDCAWRVAYGGRFACAVALAAVAADALRCPPDDAGRYRFANWEAEGARDGRA